MRKRIKKPITTSLDPDNRIKELDNEKLRVEKEKKKELTFRLPPDTDVNSPFESYPLTEKSYREKIIKSISK